MSISKFIGWFAPKAWGFIIFMVFASLAANLLLLDKVRTLGQQNQALNQQTRDLAEDLKKLAEDNIYLADRSLFYDKCVARIIAEFTQNPRVPITINKLSTCEIETSDGRIEQDFKPTLNEERQNHPDVVGQRDKPKPRPRPTTPNPPEPEPPMLFPEGEGLFRDDIPVLGIL